ncbi:MAG: hypothetical protein HUJ77_01775 [Clostridium sp.]|uniref:hypothetical protein n=1 Tax=Clostridium sp. TaxID=1506 RepID=UPI0025BE59D2|nr:hypothetical protein [Clostridium sp.]MCF0147105.1 hypothetical protein [Clostridium sp.]
MAIHDWNNDGRKGISSFGAILSTILGLVSVAFIFTIFDVNIDNVPTFIIVIMWIINSSVLSVICEIIGI